MFAGWKKKERGPGRSVKEFGRRIADLLKGSSASGETFYEALEDLLVESDFGAAAASEVVEELRRTVSPGSAGWNREVLVERLKEILRPSLRHADLMPVPGRLNLYLVLGVNGVGKTTTIAKIAHRFRMAGTDQVILAAADTFRAAAIEQLEIHGQRVGARVVKQEHGSDPAAVVYDAVGAALAGGVEVVIAGTAGRMHNRVNLVNELSKIDRIARDRIGSGAVYRKILVIDATTGQNGLRQAETFHEAVGVDAVIMTKYDSTAKGGLAAVIGRRLGLPFAYLGRGEGMDDLVPFDVDAYLDELLEGE